MRQVQRTWPRGQPGHHRHRLPVRPRGRGRGGRARRRSALAARRAGHRRAAERPRRRPAGPRDGHDVRARRPARPGGRRAADPRAERVVAADLGWWVLGIGLARYVFGVAVRAGRPAAVAARPAAVLVQDGRGAGRDRARGCGGAAAAGPGGDRAVAVVAVLLAESFLHEAVDRWRAPGAPLVVPYGTVLAFLVVWLALVAPTDRDHLTVPALLRLPLEVLVVVALALVPWPRLRVSYRGDRAAAGRAPAGQGAGPVVQHGLRPRLRPGRGLGLPRARRRRAR